MHMQPYERELIHAERARRFERLVADQAPRDGSRLRRWWYRMGERRAARQVAAVHSWAGAPAHVDRGRATIDPDRWIA